MHAMTRRRPDRTVRSAGAIAVTIGCILALTLVPASAHGATVKTFKAVKETKRALIFKPRSSQPEAVTSARVRLRNRRTGTKRVRRVGARRVRHAIDRGRRLRVRRSANAYGKLKVGFNPPAVNVPSGDGDGDGGEATAQGSIPTSWARSASFEGDLNAGTDHGWRIDSPISVTSTSEAGASEGSSAAKIVTNGGNSNCSCSRMTFDNLGLTAGREVWIGGSWRVTDPDKLRWSRLMNLGHFEGSGDPDNWYLALMVRDSGMEVVARNYDTDTGASALMRPRPIPQGRWFDVDVRLRLSRTGGEALTQVYLDGELVSSSSAQNMVGPGPLTFYNAGLPYFWNANGSTTVYFDAPRLAH